MRMMNHNAHNVLGVITARGGSKGIPQKNLAQVAGKPLITWTLDASLASKRLSRFIVSTDDQKIRDVALEYGVEAPFLRPDRLAREDSPHVDVVIHVIEWIEKNENEQYDYVVLLQPTSPFRTASDIDRAVELAFKNEAKSVVSVMASPAHPYLTKQVNEDGELIDYVDTPSRYLRRQTFPPAYVLNGAIYLIKPTVLKLERTFLPDQTYAYIMPESRSLDIDTEWDLHLAEIIMKDQNENAAS